MPIRFRDSVIIGNKKWQNSSEVQDFKKEMPQHTLLKVQAIVVVSENIITPHTLIDEPAFIRKRLSK